MTRIIAGRAGGTVLDVPSIGTRPTSDRVRESMFAALESSGELAGARVADLFAGSGALGLEAISRGALAADLVEKSEAAATVARRNLARVARAMGSDAVAQIHRRAVLPFLQTTTQRYDLVLLDPPYDLPDAELAWTLAALTPRLTADALVVVERAARSPQPLSPPTLTPERHRRYGDTAVWWLRG